MNILLVLDGVLRKSIGGEPIREGEMLYHSLVDKHRVTILSNGGVQAAKHYLLGRGIRGYADVVGSEAALPGHSLRMRQIALQQASGHVDIFIDADPGMVASAMAQGITSLLFCQPAYTRPEFRPDYRAPKRPWAAIEAEMATRAMVGNDERLAGTDAEMILWEDVEEDEE